MCRCRGSSAFVATFDPANGITGWRFRVFSAHFSYAATSSRGCTWSVGPGAARTEPRQEASSSCGPRSGRGCRSGGSRWTSFGKKQSSPRSDASSRGNCSSSRCTYDLGPCGAARGCSTSGKTGHATSHRRACTTTSTGACAIRTRRTRATPSYNSLSGWSGF